MEGFSIVVEIGVGKTPGFILSFDGSTGNVPKGPSCTFLFAGGRPLGFAPGVLFDGHALDTAGPCFRLLLGVTADLGSPSNAASM